MVKHLSAPILAFGLLGNQCLLGSEVQSICPLGLSGNLVASIALEQALWGSETLFSVEINVAWNGLPGQEETPLDFVSFSLQNAAGENLVPPSGMSRFYPRFHFVVRGLSGRRVRPGDKVALEIDFFNSHHDNTLRLSTELIVEAPEGSAEPVPAGEARVIARSKAGFIFPGIALPLNKDAELCFSRSSSALPKPYSKVELILEMKDFQSWLKRMEIPASELTVNSMGPVRFKIPRDFLKHFADYDTLKVKAYHDASGGATSDAAAFFLRY